MGLLERMEQQRLGQNDKAQEEGKKEVFHVDIHQDLKNRVHQEVINEINSNKLENVGKENTIEILRILENVMTVEAENVNRMDRSRITEELLNEIIGYGPLEVLLNDPDISEIMVNGYNRVYIEKNGKIQLSPVVFQDNQHVMNVIDRIVSSVGRHIDESSPMVDARLQDGSRVNVVIPPLSLVGPVITIRKFSKKPITTDQLLGYGSISKKMLSFLEACVKGKLNIIVSGGTGSGKTTMLNVLSSFIPDNERIITIEDSAELRLDRIIVGEVRSAETIDMLQAMNTGHDGSLTTIHANTPRDSLSRIETMVLMSGMDLPLRAIRDQTTSAIDIIIQQSRLRDGTRKVVNITEVTGLEGDVIVMQDIFSYEMTGQLDTDGKFKGRFKSMGIKPRCLEKITHNGVMVNDDWFIE
jgi:pilus assembly protein CpaF